MAIAKQEAEMVLSLTQYFNPFWLIVDVGSHKGEWFDALIDYRDTSTEALKYNVISVEPNDKLRSYQEVKYSYNPNIIFRSNAISDKEELVDFYHWDNKHSGLSSILNNKKWEKEILDRKRKTIHSSTLDNIFEVLEIDIIKIDVEGAEKLVIDGAKRILKEKQVKFIQIEYSEHYKVGGFTFKSIIELVNDFGYKVWSWDGKYFNEVKAGEFVEDYHAENYIISYLEIGRYEYTQLWNSEFKKNTEFLKGKVHLALEIGCFEGLSSNHICDCLLNKDVDGSRLICVDPLTDIYLPDHKDNEMFKGQYERFIKNTKGQPIELVRKKSSEAYNYLSQYLFDFVYVDGDHTEEGVFMDAEFSFNVLRLNGYMLFDDYGQSKETKTGIDKFLDKNKGNLEILVRDYQVLIKKTI
jgi:FkbM family methyltransferase